MKLFFVLSTVIYLSLALADDTALKEFNFGNNLFTASIYEKAQKHVDGESVVLSTFSLQSLLALAQSGAKNETAQEMRDALHLPDSQEKIENLFKALRPQLKKSNLYTFRTATKIYLKQDIAVRDEFKKIANDVFEADLENIDFSKNGESVQRINNWVEEHTNIKNIVYPVLINDRTRAILLSALYFTANWSDPFRKFSAQPRNFYNGKKIIEVKTMKDTTEKNYYESEELNAKFLELDFEGSDVSLIIVLPNKRDGLETIESQLEKAIKTPKFTKEYVSILLPKFKIQTHYYFDWYLRQMGMKKVFDENQADLSGIGGEKGDLAINYVIQKVRIEFDEEEFEETADNLNRVKIALSQNIDTTPKEFIADHPFLFYIKVKDLILFVGRVVDPTEFRDY